MRLHTALSVLPALLPLVVLTATPASAAAPVYGELAYVHYDGTTYDLWSVNTDGTVNAPLPTQADSAPPVPATTAKVELEHMPVFSPDGQFLAFEGRRTGGTDAGVFLQNRQTGAVTVLVDEANRVEGPTGWYVDAAGQHLTYVRDKAGDNVALDAWDVLVLPDGTAGATRQLTAFAGSLMSTAVVGQTLVFDYGTTHASADHGICMAPLPTGTTPTTSMTCLTSGYDDRGPSVSSLNGDIAFARNSAGREKISILHGTREHWTTSTNKNTTQLSLPTSLKGVGYPAYSPGGDAIAFAAGTSTALSSYDIYVAPATGGTPKRLTTQANSDYVPTWRR